jgi:hypothetical protein
MKPFTVLSVVVFALVGALHLVRALLGWDVRVDGMDFPVWASYVAAAGAALLAVMLWRENRGAR